MIEPAISSFGFMRRNTNNEVVVGPLLLFPKFFFNARTRRAFDDCLPLLYFLTLAVLLSLGVWLVWGRPLKLHSMVPDAHCGFWHWNIAVFFSAVLLISRGAELPLGGSCTPCEVLLVLVFQLTTLEGIVS